MTLCPQVCLLFWSRIVMDGLTEIVHEVEYSYLNRRVLWKCTLKNLCYKMMLMLLSHSPLT